MNPEKTGTLIRETRWEKGMTQQALADALNMSATAISKWENGHSLPDISLLEVLSETLGLSISELVLGERSETMQKPIKQNEAEDAAIRSVIRTSILQRKRHLIQWIAVAVLATGILAAAIICLFFIGLRPKEADILAWTEIQEGYNGNPEWVIHFETRNGQPLMAHSEAVVTASENGDKTVNGSILHLRVPPLGHIDPGNFTWGYSIEGGLAPTPEYDYLVTVHYSDKNKTYSLREEGLFD